MRGKLLAIVSFITISVLGIVVAQSRSHSYLSEWCFWASLIVLSTFIVLQISWSDKNPYAYALILLQIIIATFVLRTLLVSTNQVLAGYDAYNELTALTLVSSAGHWDPNQLSGYAYSYPMLYSLGLVWSSILGVGLFTTAKWMVLSFCFISPLFVFLIVNRRYSKTAGLISCLMFSFIYISIFFHTTFQRETIAVPLLLLAMFLYLKASENGTRARTYLILTFLASIACVLSHHMTSFILLVFFALFLAVDRFRSSIHSRSRKSTAHDQLRTSRAVSVTFVVLLFVLVFGYWAYLKYSPLEIIGLIIKESAVIQPGTGFHVPGMLRYQVLLWGELTFAVLFSILSIGTVYSLRKRRESLDITALLFGGAMSVIMILTLSGRLLPSEGMGLGSRFQTFAYLGFFVVLGLGFWKVLVLGRRHVRQFVGVILILWILFNVYRLPPSLYSQVDSFEPGDARPLVSQAEASAASFLGLGTVDVAADSSLNGYFKYSSFIGGHGVADGVNYVLHSGLAPSTAPQLDEAICARIYANRQAQVFSSQSS